MRKNFFWIIVLIIGIASCGQGPQTSTEEAEPQEQVLVSEAHQAFFNHLASLCGKSFAGKQVYRSHHGSSWAEKTLIMHVTVCEDLQIHIPFHVDEDKSRTWMFLVEDGMLRFRHQHLHEDGTHEDDSMYGGYANDEGGAFVQYFPADEFTAGVIENGGGNLWIVSMNEAMTYFSYRLDRDGEKRFEIVFDLTQPIE